MTAKLVKKIVTVISFLLMIGNCSPIYAQLVELEILGGGYKLRGPSEINFATQTTSTSPASNTLDFRDIGDTTPSQSSNNFLMIIDENGGNPFDITVTSQELKRNEPLVTRTTTGSTASQLKVANSSGFLADDTFVFSGFGGSHVYKIASVPDSTTINIEGTFYDQPIPAAIDINRYVDCSISPRRCIPLNNFLINHGATIDTVNGNSNDFQTNSQTGDFTPFIGQTTTIAGSSGNSLKVSDSSQFLPSESITFASDSGTVPLTNTIATISDDHTIILQNSMTTPPAAGTTVDSSSIRTLTLGNGTGAAPGEWKIYPVLKNTISAGQLPGTYETVLNFTIV